MKADYVLWGRLVPEWHLTHIVQVVFQLWGQQEVDILASSHTIQCQDYYTLENLVPLGTLGLNAFNHPLMYEVRYIFPPLALLLSKLLAEHIIDQFRLLILVGPCLMEAPWFPSVLTMLEDIPHECPIIKDLVRDVPVDWVLKGLPSLHLTLWLLSDIHCIDKGSLLSLSGSSRCQSNIYKKGLLAILER